MAEYIERKAAYPLAKKVSDAVAKGDYHISTFGQVILDWIDDIPAADVVPVRHGRWIEDGYYGEPCVCSNCGEPCKDTVMGKPRWHYCPMCGARCDGGQDNDC